MTPIVVILAILAVALAAGLGVMIGRSLSGGVASPGGFQLPKNWKTSISGLITGVAGWIVLSPENFAQWPWILSLAKYVMAGGFVALGLTAKDSTTHSTVQETEVATVKDEVAKAPKTP